MRILQIILLICIAFNARASGVSSAMKEFWDASGGVSNFSGPSSYEGQAAGYYTLGNLYARTPVKTAQLGSVTLPSMKAGCGGINMYNGAFSFVNSMELERLAKAIVNNSKAFALHLAIETMSPVIAEKLEEIQSWIQRVNAMNINSCETAASLVGGMWPRHERSSETICATLANGSGIVSDYAAAKHECHSNKEGIRNKIKSKDKDAYEKLMVEDVNLTWKAVKPLFNAQEKELAQLFMTLAGTIIIKSNGNTPTYEYIGSQAAHNNIISVFMEGGTIKYHQCDEVEKCLNPVKEGGSHKIQEGFKSKVEKIVFSLIEKIKNDEMLSKEEKQFLNYKSTLPLYKILNIYAAYSQAGALFELPIYAEAIALQLMFEYLNDVLRQVETASNNLIIASEDHIKELKNNIQQAKKALRDREFKTHQSYATLMKLVERAAIVEGVLANQIDSPITENLRWSRNL